MLVPEDRFPGSSALLERVSIEQPDNSIFVITIEPGYKLEVFPRLPKILALVMQLSNGNPPLVELREGDRYRGFYSPDTVEWLAKD